MATKLERLPGLAAFFDDKMWTNPKINLSFVRNILLMRIFSFFVFCILAAPCTAQRLDGLSSKWDDSFVEWELLSTVYDTIDGEEEAQDEVIGEMKLRWLNAREDWTDWEYELYGERGVIKTKWREDLSHWELRSYTGDIITMRTAWAGDFTQWRVTNNQVALSFRSKWTNQFDEWLVDDRNYGSFSVYTLRRGDPRDWGVDDRLDESIPEPMKLAMVFLAVFYATPKE